MAIILILAIIGLLIYLGTRKKGNRNFSGNKSHGFNNVPMPKTILTEQNFKSKISEIQFPDRVDLIVWHVNAINKGLANGDLGLANLSYAKLIESIRQQNVNEHGNYEDVLQTIREEYEQFRKTFNMEYPAQFLPPARRQKNPFTTKSTNNFQTQTITSDDSKLNFLISGIVSQGHPEYPLLRKEYAVVSGMPYQDFSAWVIEQLKQKDYSSLFAFVVEFYRDRDGAGAQGLKLILEKFLTKNFRLLFKSIDDQAIYEIQASFILKHGMADFSREFWIVEKKESEMLCKILSVYSFSINPGSFAPLIKKANAFLREMRKIGDFWKDYENYKIEELKTENKIEGDSDLFSKLQQLTPGERLHFFDFASIYSNRKFWNGGSSAKTRSYGINEKESIDKISTLDVFQIVNDINAVSEITSKGELKEKAEKAGFEIKKSWTLDKIFESLMKTENGQVFLKEFIKGKTILSFRQGYKADLNRVLNYQFDIQRTVDLIAMM